MSQNPQQSSQVACPKSLVYLGVTAIVVATLLAYMPAIGAEFIWDDDDYVSQNQLLEDLNGLGKIWSLWIGTAPDGSQYLVSHTPQYYPMVFSTFWLESRLWGRSNPTGFHVVNILLHIANALLIWLVCHRLGFSWAYLAALIFALHPVEVESVAWITERKNVLSGLFYLLAVLAYLRFDASRGKAFYLTALGFFVLALLSKTVTCTLPVVLLLILWLRHPRLSRSDLLRLVPFFAAGAIFGLFTAYLERYRVGAIGEEWQIDFWRRWVIAGKDIFFYVSKLVCPTKLTFVYPRWDTQAFSLLGLLWPTAVILLTWILWFLRKAIGRAPLVAWSCFIVTLFPALGFFDVYPFRYSFVADHFQYLASTFCIALLVGLVHDVYHRFWPGSFKIPASPAGWIVSSAIVSILMGYLTYAQTGTYRDLDSLWDHTIRNNPGAWLAWDNRGVLRAERGELELAMRDYEKAIELNPKSVKAYENRGLLYVRRGDRDRAIRDFEKAIELDSRSVRAYVNRGIVYMSMGDNERAIRDFDKAIGLDRRSVKAYVNRGIIYAGKREFLLAIGDFDQAIELDPKSVQAYVNRGVVYASKGDNKRAIRDFEKAIELDPRSVQAYSNMVFALLKQKRFGEALKYCDQAMRQGCDHPRPLNTLACILATHEDAAVRDGAEAMRLAERACQLTDYKVDGILDTLAAAHAEVGQFDKAVEFAGKAIQLAEAAGRRELATDIRSRLELYKDRRAFRQPFSP